MRFMDRRPSVHLIAVDFATQALLALGVGLAASLALGATALLLAGAA